MRRGLIVVVAIAAVLPVAAALLAGRGVSAARHRPWLLEARIARASWRFLVPSNVRSARNPVSDTASALAEAREHWADHCATCHDNDGSGSTAIGRRVYPRVPDLRGPQTQRLTDGELFYAIEQGIPWTAMPGWSIRTAEGERESWTLVRFIRHLPAITSDELKEMERLNPRPPPNAEKEKEIDDFLNGPATKGRGSSN